jgi:hypothetical protein
MPYILDNLHQSVGAIGARHRVGDRPPRQYILLVSSKLPGCNCKGCKLCICESSEASPQPLHCVRADPWSCRAFPAGKLGNPAALKMRAERTAES